MGRKNDELFDNRFGNVTVSRNCDYKRYKYAREIIQIEAVLLDEAYQQISTFNEYVSSKYGVIVKRF